MSAPVVAKSRVLRDGIPVTEWSADRQSAELNTSIQSSFISLSLLSLAIGMVSANLEARSLAASRVGPQQVVLHAKLPRPASVYFSHPLLGTTYVKPWSRIRDASDLFDEYEWENPPLYISQQPHAAVSVKRETDFQIIKPSAVISLTPEEAAAKALPKSGLSEYTPTYPELAPTEGELAAWRKKYLTRDGSSFKKRSTRELSLSRFQFVSHQNYKFKKNSDGAAPWAFEDGLNGTDLEEEKRQREDPDQNQNRAVDITEDFTSKPKPLQARPRKLDQLIDDFNSHVQPDLKRKLTERTVGNGERVFVDCATRSEIDWWEERLTREFRLDFERERNRDDVQFEQWRREAQKLRSHEDFKHWHDLLESTPPPSWGKTQSTGRPEPRGKFRVVSRTKRGFAQGNWFDYVFHGDEIQQTPDKKAVELVVSKKQGTNRKKFNTILEIIYNPAKRQAAARKEGIRVKSMAKREQRAKKEIVNSQRSSGRLFDPRMLSPKHIHQILEQGGSYVVLPGRVKNTLELIPVKEEFDPARRGLLDGLRGRSSDAEILGGSEIRLKKEVVAELCRRNLPTGRRKRDIKVAHEHLSRRFESAEAVHFGDPERLREQIIDRVSLNNDAESL